MNIKQALFNHYAKRHPMHAQAYPQWEKVSSVFVLFESEWQERNPEIRAIVQQLQEEDKQVVNWGYLKKDKLLSPNLPESRILAPKDFNWIQRPKSDVLLFLERHHFDVLIDLTTTPLLPMQYVALLTQAKFKIGTHEAPYYDMVVPCVHGATAEYMYQQIRHFLTTIKSAD